MRGQDGRRHLQEHLKKVLGGLEEASKMKVNHTNNVVSYFTSEMDGKDQIRVTDSFDDSVFCPGIHDICNPPKMISLTTTSAFPLLDKRVTLR